jgi:hypothetical protein
VVVYSGRLPPRPEGARALPGARRGFASKPLVRALREFPAGGRTNRDWGTCLVHGSSVRPPGGIRKRGDRLLVTAFQGLGRSDPRPWQRPCALRAKSRRRRAIARIDDHPKCPQVVIYSPLPPPTGSPALDEPLFTGNLLPRPVRSSQAPTLEGVSWRSHRIHVQWLARSS